MIPFILLENGKKIKVKDIHLYRDNNEFKIKISINIKYLGYFSSQETSIKEVFYKGLFKRTKGVFIQQDTVPEYFIENKELIIIVKVEEL